MVAAARYRCRAVGRWRRGRRRCPRTRSRLSRYLEPTGARLTHRPSHRSLQANLSREWARYARWVSVPTAIFLRRAQNHSRAVRHLRARHAHKCTGTQAPRHTGTFYMRPIRRCQHINPAFALSVVSALTLMVSACGGYGGGSSSAGGQGCGGPYSGACAAPTITVASPGATVDRTVQLKAGASAASGASVTRVDFLIDGTTVGTATAAPFSANWDSTTVVDGTHTLVGKVTDNMSQTTSSALVTFKVNNNPTFSVEMAATQLFPAPQSAATGTASVTVKLATGAVSGKVTLTGIVSTAVTMRGHARGVDDATGAEGNRGAAESTATKRVAPPEEAVRRGHWSTDLAAITATDVDNFKANKWYVNVATPAQVHGAIRGQVDFATTAPPPAPTLTQLKTSAFSVCGGCHTGGGTSLPASMDPAPAHIYASILDGASVEQPALNRVE